MAFLSLGTFLLVVWLVILLPGQDTTDWQRQHPVAASAAEAGLPVEPPKLAAARMVYIGQYRWRGWLHWHSDCPALNYRHHNAYGDYKIISMTFAQAQKQNIIPCFYCRGIDARNETDNGLKAHLQQLLIR